MKNVSLMACCLSILLVSCGCAGNGLRPVKAPVTIDPGDKLIVQRFVEHAAQTARTITKQKCEEIKTPETFCWVVFPQLEMSLTAYELTGRTSHLRDFVRAFENLRSTITRGQDGFLGWYGKPTAYLSDPAKPDAIIDEIQTSFRAVAVVSRFLELLESEPKLSKEFRGLRRDYLDLMENHLVRKWEARGYYADLGKSGAVYRWNAAYNPSKSNLTLAHEKHSLMIGGLLNLYRVTRNGTYMKKAIKLGLRFKKSLRLEDDHYAWGYWDPAGRWDVDSKNARKWKHWIGPEPKGVWYAASVGAAISLYHHGLLFDRTDLDRFLKTQMEVCWNGDAESPSFFFTNGAKAKQGRFISPALAPFDERIAGFLYTGPRQQERVARSDNAWHGGVIAARWLEGKYLYLPRARAGRRIHAHCREDFLSDAANREFLEALEFDVVAPGYKVPLTPDLPE